MFKWTVWFWWLAKVIQLAKMWVKKKYQLTETQYQLWIFSNEFIQFIRYIWVKCGIVYLRPYMRCLLKKGGEKTLNITDMIQEAHIIMMGASLSNTYHMIHCELIDFDQHIKACLLEMGHRSHHLLTVRELNAAIFYANSLDYLPSLSHAHSARWFVQDFAYILFTLLWFTGA